MAIQMLDKIFKPRRIALDARAVSNVRLLPATYYYF